MNGSTQKQAKVMAMVSTVLAVLLLVPTLVLGGMALLQGALLAVLAFVAVWGVGLWLLRGYRQEAAGDVEPSPLLWWVSLFFNAPPVVTWCATWSRPVEAVSMVPLIVWPVIACVLSVQALRMLHVRHAAPTT